MILKRTLALLACFLVLVACLSLTAFADFVEEYQLGFGSYEVRDYADTDYQIDFATEDGFAYIDYKNFTGALRIGRTPLTQLQVEPQTYHFDFDVGFGYVTEDYNPRYKVGAFQGSTFMNDRTYNGSIGWTFRVSPDYNEVYLWRSVGLSNSVDRFTFDDDYLVEVGDYTSVIGYIEYDYITSTATLSLYRRSLDSFVAVDSYSCHIFGYDCTFECYDAILPTSYSSARFKLSPAYYTLFDREYYFSQGYNYGYDDGYTEGREEGVIQGRDEGYNEGYADGKLDGEVSEIAVPNVISTIMNSTVTLFRNIFGFELFGINISALIGSIALVCVLAWLIRKLVK